MVISELNPILHMWFRDRAGFPLLFKKFKGNLTILTSKVFFPMMDGRGEGSLMVKNTSHSTGAETTLSIGLQYVSFLSHTGK